MFFFYNKCLFFYIKYILYLFYYARLYTVLAVNMDEISVSREKCLQWELFLIVWER